MARSFRVKFHTEKDLNECLKVLGDYFPIETYSPDDLHLPLKSSRPTMLQSLFFHATKDTLALEQPTTMTLKTDFIRQYLSTCIMDPAFVILVNTNEELLKKMLREQQT